jgi:hypothetical protein
VSCLGSRERLQTRLTSSALVTQRDFRLDATRLTRRHPTDNAPLSTLCELPNAVLTRCIPSDRHMATMTMTVYLYGFSGSSVVRLSSIHVETCRDPRSTGSTLASTHGIGNSYRRSAAMTCTLMLLGRKVCTTPHHPSDRCAGCGVGGADTEEVGEEGTVAASVGVISLDRSRWPV